MKIVVLLDRLCAIGSMEADQGPLFVDPLRAMRGANRWRDSIALLWKRCFTLRSPSPPITNSSLEVGIGNIVF